MTQRTIGRASRVALVAGIFAAGFLCGSVTRRDAGAQVGEMMKKAGESGALGSVGQLGAAIVDMQQHVNELQKNLDTLKKVKSALGG
jgi:hypothetical protein